MTDNANFEITTRIVAGDDGTNYDAVAVAVGLHWTVVADAWTPALLARCRVGKLCLQELERLKVCRSQGLGRAGPLSLGQVVIDQAAMSYGWISPER